MEQYIWTEKYISCFKKAESRSRSRMWSSSMSLLKDTCCPHKYLLLSLLPPIHEVYHYIGAFESLFSFSFSPQTLRSFIISERSTFVKTLSWKDATLFEEMWTQTAYLWYSHLSNRKLYTASTNEGRKHKLAISNTLNAILKQWHRKGSMSG